MKKTGYLGLSLFLMLALAAPAISQGPPPQAKTRAEYDAYMAVFNEKDPQKKAELGEKFLVDYKTSDFVKDANLIVVRAWALAKNCNKLMEAADRLAGVAGATNDNKANAYIEAMNCSQEANNFPKIVEYGDKILALDPNNLNALIVLATMLPERLPADEAGKTAALRKAEGHATKALGNLTGMAKPAGIDDAAWNQFKSGTLGQLHGSMGLIHLTRMDYEKSISSYEEALKHTPKDWISRFRLGLAISSQIPSKSEAMVEAINEENRLKREKGDQVLIEEQAAKGQGLAELIRQLRDQAIDQLATAVAIGGDQAKPAKDQLEKLWKSKNGESLEGLDAFINQKKTEVASLRD